MIDLEKFLQHDTEVYLLGQTVWYHGHGQEMSSGEIIALLKIPGYTYIHYLISTPTAIEPVLEVRTYDTLSDTPEGPINLYKQLGRFYHERY